MAIRKLKGFTLVELMVVVAIVGTLAATTIPLGRIWVDGAKVTSVESELREAFGKAKSVALRNAKMATDQQAVTAICLSELNSLRVLARNSAGAPDCSTAQGELLWSAELNTDVSIISGGNAVSCMCFDSSGLLTNNDCASCLTGADLQVTSGAKTETLLIY